MGIRMIYRGIGKGSLFGHGRIFGVHNPIGSKLGKASDPYINLKALSMLSLNDNPEIHNAAAENIAGRLRAPRGKAHVENIFRSIDRKMLARVISVETFKDKGVQNAITRFMTKLSKEELRQGHFRRALIMLTSVPKNVDPENASIAFSFLAEGITADELELIAMLGPAPDVANIMASDKAGFDALYKGVPKMMSRRAFLLLGLHDYGADNSISSNVYSKLEKALTRKELDFLSVSKSKRILEHICLTGLSSPEAVANAVIGMTAKTVNGYDMKSLEKASLLIIARPAHSNMILSYLMKADVSLTNLIIKRIAQSKPSPMIIEPRNGQ